MRRAGPGLGPEYVGPGRASGLSTSGRAGPRAWVEDFGPGSGLEFRPVATSSVYVLRKGTEPRGSINFVHNLWASRDKESHALEEPC